MTEELHFGKSLQALTRSIYVVPVVRATENHIHSFIIEYISFRVFNDTYTPRYPHLSKLNSDIGLYCEHLRPYENLKSKN